MTFTERVWANTAGIRSAIDELPFVVRLGDGTLDRARFSYYLAQDAHYLREYARALAAAAAKADSVDDLAFFARSAQSAGVVERELHRRHVHDVESHRPSPTCRAYTDYLLGIAHSQGYPELTAAVLPCFWIYADVGSRLLALARDRFGRLADHPYGDWIGMYADQEFAEAAAAARAITDRAASSADPGTVERMHEAFTTASRYEWMFWDAAWRQEAWPI